MYIFTQLNHRILYNRRIEQYHHCRTIPIDVSRTAKIVFHINNQCQIETTLDPRLGCGCLCYSLYSHRLLNQTLVVFMSLMQDKTSQVATPHVHARQNQSGRNSACSCKTKPVRSQLRMFMQDKTSQVATPH
eukprot:scpid109931/ scgid25203/ 